MTSIRQAGAVCKRLPLVIALICALPALALSDDAVLTERALAKASEQVSQVANTHPDCVTAHPFYFEIGNKNQPLTTGAVGDNAPQASTRMRIASATKWWFSAYVVQRSKGNLSPHDIAALTMRSGYTSQRFRRCVYRADARQQALTVQACFQMKGLVRANNDHYTPEHHGIYYYNGGHFQHWSVSNGLGALNSSELGSAFGRTLGPSLQITFDTPQPAGGGVSDAAAYGQFLRAILQGELLIRDYLGAHAVCTHTQHCSDKAAYTPVPDEQSWSYSLGHWVEDDPNTGDGAFSSPGFFGFYPWIDASKRWYGIIAREKRGLFQRPAQQSARCGAALRQAWLSTLNQFDQ